MSPGRVSPAPGAGRSSSLDILAVMVVPPFQRAASPARRGDFPSCYIQSVIEFPPPAISWDSLAVHGSPLPLPMIYFHPKHQLHDPEPVWIVMAFILVFWPSWPHGE